MKVSVFKANNMGLAGGEGGLATREAHKNFLGSGGGLHWLINAENEAWRSGVGAASALTKLPRHKNPSEPACPPGCSRLR